jgi:hypothetical protein
VSDRAARILALTAGWWWRLPTLEANMTTPGIAAYRLAFLLFLPACHAWQPVMVASNTGFQGGKVRVERKAASSDSLLGSPGRSAGRSHAPVVFNPAWVDGDSLFGIRSGSAQPVAIAVADVRRAEERRFSGWRTGLLVVGIAVGAFASVVTVALATW